MLIQAGIHAGEIDGKDATMMLLRDLRPPVKLGDLLDHIVLLFVPILNVDGFSCFGPYSRMNQRGPRQVGRHTNDQNLNLNRDFGKLDAPETRALVAVLNAWAPDLYIDTHVTDGVDYRYDVTFGHTAGRHGWSPEISSWIDEHLLPDAVAALEKEGHTPGPLILSVNDRDLTRRPLRFLRQRPLHHRLCKPAPHPGHSDRKSFAQDVSPEIAGTLRAARVAD